MLGTTSVLRPVVGAALVAVVLAAGTTTAAAAPYDMSRFHDTDSFVINDFCGDLTVRFDSHDQGVFVARPTGPDRLPRFTVSHHGGATVTNLATGISFSITWNYLEQDVRVTDNGDGTLTVVSQVPGPERWYGPDGTVLFTDGGTIRFEFLIDDAGTPSDPSDDAFISGEVISAAGGRPQDFDLCAAFRTLTA
jgi:hypothetical protein